MFRYILASKKMRFILIVLIFIFTLLNINVGYKLLTEKQIYKSKAEGVGEKVMVFDQPDWHAEFVYRWEYPKFYWSLRNLRVKSQYKIMHRRFLHIGETKEVVRREGWPNDNSLQWNIGDPAPSGEVEVPRNRGCWFQLDVQMAMNSISRGGADEEQKDEKSDVGMITNCSSTEIPTPTVTITPSPTATEAPTPTPTNTPIPTATSTPGPTATTAPVPVGCGVKACDNITNPCRSGLTCVQANDGSNYCALPEYQTACRENPSLTSCCTAPGNTPTPTEIVLVKITNTPQPTYVAAQPTVPSAGFRNFPIVLAIPAILLLLGLIF